MWIDLITGCDLFMEDTNYESILTSTSVKEAKIEREPLVYKGACYGDETYRKGSTFGGLVMDNQISHRGKGE